MTSEAAERLFDIRGLVRRYGDRTVLAGLDFEIFRGECLIILGRSGSGKSVTLRQLNGLEQPNEGSILFDGIDITRLSERELFPIRRRVAMLFQSGALFDSMTVFENIAFPLREHTDLDEEGLRSRVAQKLEVVGLGEIEEVMPSALSGGMRKRVALARSLALEPEVVLFDEPTTGLDPVTSSTIAELILTTRAKTGVTAVVVTHDVALARAVGSRIAFLHDGRLAFVGGWEEADDSDHPALRAFLASKEGGRAA